ncbi:hypothetical protein FDECE_14037 [Fusarium decemcellulare]|nr:hypothetical protein FDECE_14037 [Fusarium decemcellulare]
MVPPKRSLPALQPKVPNPAAAEEDTALAVATLPRKRQAVSNACNNCRKKKVKCDGAYPRCGPCIKKDLRCEFAEPEDPHSREAERHQLVKYQGVFDLIRQGSPAESMAALQRIRDADDIDSAVNSIAEAQLLMQAPSSNTASVSESDVPQWRQQFETFRSENRRIRSPFYDPSFMFERQYTVDARDQHVDSEMFVDVANRDLPLSRWTTVSNDDRHMNYLLTMFFTWDNVVERVFYRPIFEEDVVSMDPSLADRQPGSFCTRFLVNALLAASCLFAPDPIIFTDPQDSTTRGRRWAEEAEALLEDIDKPSLPLLQGLYSLFVYEGAIGSGTKSVHYFLRSMDVYKELNDAIAVQPREDADKARLERERLATSWCMWGFYCCEW